MDIDKLLKYTNFKNLSRFDYDEKEIDLVLQIDYRNYRTLIENDFQFEKIGYFDRMVICNIIKGSNGAI